MMMWYKFLMLRLGYCCQCIFCFELEATTSIACLCVMKGLARLGDSISSRWDRKYDSYSVFATSMKSIQFILRIFASSWNYFHGMMDWCASLYRGFIEEAWFIALALGFLLVRPFWDCKKDPFWVCFRKFALFLVIIGLELWKNHRAALLLCLS